jgi:hypothetical protein
MSHNHLQHKQDHQNKKSHSGHFQQVFNLTHYHILLILLIYNNKNFPQTLEYGQAPSNSSTSSEDEVQDDHTSVETEREESHHLHTERDPGALSMNSRRSSHSQSEEEDEKSSDELGEDPEAGNKSSTSAFTSNGNEFCLENLERPSNRKLRRSRTTFTTYQLHQVVHSCKTV